MWGVLSLVTFFARAKKVMRLPGAPGQCPSPNRINQIPRITLRYIRATIATPDNRNT
jgi:hypothetical protein